VRQFGIDPRTVAKMMRFGAAIIDGILNEDKGGPKKRQHTAKRIFERLRNEHDADGSLRQLEVKR
jgi:hypothetical protein